MPNEQDVDKGQPEQKSGADQPRTVKLTDVGAYKRIAKPKAKGTFLQESGVRIFKWMLWLTSFVLAALFAYLIWETLRVPHLTPRMPADSAGAIRDTVMARLLLEQRQAVFSNFGTGVEKIVIAFLLPLLTAILGYLFGTQAGSTSGSGDEDVPNEG